VNNFDINLPKGLFVLQVQGNEFNFTEKIINPFGSANLSDISYVGTSEQQSLKPQKINGDINSTTQLVYNTGDCLLYKAKSGNNTTVVTDVPTATHSINFNFVVCQDADLKPLQFLLIQF
jgi:hypothetical protein